MAWHLLGGSGDDDSKSELQNESNDESTNGLKVVMLEAREACWGATGRVGTVHFFSVGMRGGRRPSICDLQWVLIQLLLKVERVRESNPDGLDQSRAFRIGQRKHARCLYIAARMTCLMDNVTCKA